MKYRLKGLDCPECAATIEESLETEGIQNSGVNFLTKSISIEPRDANRVQNIIDKVKPGIVLISEEKKDYEAEEDRGRITSIIIAALLLTMGMIFRESLHETKYYWAEYVIFLSAYFLAGWKVLKTALNNILHGRIFDENFLMSIATIGAIAIHELPEAVGVMLFFDIGEFFQDMAVNKSRRSIKSIMDIRPKYANLKDNGEIKKVSPETVNVGDIIIVRPGEKIPLDGDILDGTSFLDTSALTGESVPRRVKIGDSVLSGMVNGDGLLTIKVTKGFHDSSVARILELVENAGTRKAPTERFITRFSRYYTPIVVFAAMGIALIPPLVIPNATFSQWAYRALVLLVISCPCALIVSIPLGYFGGIGGASREGILIKGANFLDAMANLHTVVFDKTGTLTEGVFKVTNVVEKNGFTKEEVLRLAAIAEAYSNHPIAISIREGYGKEIEINKIREYQEIAGHGVRVSVEDKVIVAGNDRLLFNQGIEYDVSQIPNTETVVYVAVNRTLAGYIIISDTLKSDSKETMHKLKSLGVKRLVMLTGDNRRVAENIAHELELDTFYTDLLPEDKVNKVEELMSHMGDEKLAFVGDGINDAPVITRADIGIAMGGLGSDAAIEAADIILMEDMPSKIPTAIKIARRTNRIITQNIVLALVVKVLFIIAGTLGLASMWEAVFADVGVALLAILNSTRTLRYRKA